MESVAASFLADGQHHLAFLLGDGEGDGGIIFLLVAARSPAVLGSLLGVVATVVVV